MKPIANEKGASSASLIPTLMSSPFLELFEIEIAFPLEEFNQNNCTGTSMRSLSIPDSFNPSANFSRPTLDDDRFVIDQAYVSRASSTSDYLNWQFEVGGHVAVAYSVVGENSVADDELDSAADELTSPSISFEDNRHSHGNALDNADVGNIQTSASNHTIDLQANSNDVSRISLNGWNSAVTFGESERTGEYKRLVLAPRSLPPPLPPFKGGVDEAKPSKQKPWKQNRKAPEEDYSETQPRNMFDSLESFDDDDDENGDDEDVAFYDERKISPVSDAAIDNEWTWSCSYCTFINDSSKGPRICVMCENISPF